MHLTKQIPSENERIVVDKIGKTIYHQCSKKVDSTVRLWLNGVCACDDMGFYLFCFGLAVV